MAEEAPEQGQAEEPKKKSFPKTLIVCVITALLSGGVGAVIPVMLMVSSTEEADARQLTGEMAFVPFGDVTVNLNDGRLSRYLRVKIVLQVDKFDEAEMIKKVEQKLSMLKSWLLSHLAGKTMEDIRGTAGQNLLRREIHDHFNEALSEDSFDRINDILFEEFNVQ